MHNKYERHLFAFTHHPSHTHNNSLHTLWNATNKMTHLCDIFHANRKVPLRKTQMTYRTYKYFLNSNQFNKDYKHLGSKATFQNTRLYNPKGVYLFRWKKMKAYEEKMLSITTKKKNKHRRLWHQFYVKKITINT